MKLPTCINGDLLMTSAERKLGLGMLLMAVLNLPVSAATVTVVDQDALSGRSPSFQTTTGFNVVAHVAQTYTAGATGSLTRANVVICASGAVRLQLRDVTDGRPGPTVLASATAEPPVCDGTFTRVTSFDLLAPQAAGTRYAIEVSLLEDGFAQVAFQSSQQYQAGGIFVTSGDTWDPRDYDAYFQTLVQVSDDAPPTTTFVAPQNGAQYQLRSQVQVAYSCSDAETTVTYCSGSAPVGSLLDTSRVGDKTFFVTATDAAGNTITNLVNYKIVGGPTSRPGRPPR